MNGSGRLILTAAAAGLVLVVVGCGGTSGGRTLADGPSPLPSASLARPTVVGVTCEANGTITTTGTAVVDRDGLHLTVTDRSGRKDTYLNYGSGRAGGAGGGDAVPAGTTERVLMVPPGDVYLDCSYDLGAKTTAPVRVRATDPNGYHRLVTLDALGCSPGAFVDWGPGPTRGRTAEAALGALVVASAQRSGLHTRFAPVGYVGSGFLTYILEREGRSWAIAIVSSERGQYQARLDRLC